MGKKKPPQKHPGGRPSKYDPSYARVAYGLALAGYPDYKIAREMGISVDTFSRWLAGKPEFSEKVKQGRSGTVKSVAKALVDRARGAKHRAEKIFMTKDGEIVRVPTVQRYAPDTNAIIFYLTNRAGDEWKQVSRQEQTGPGGGAIETKQTVSLDGLESEEIKTLRALAEKVKKSQASKKAQP